MTVDNILSSTGMDRMALYNLLHCYLSSCTNCSKTIANLNLKHNLDLKPCKNGNCIFCKLEQIGMEDYV